MTVVPWITTRGNAAPICANGQTHLYSLPASTPRDHAIRVRQHKLCTSSDVHQCIYALGKASACDIVMRDCIQIQTIFEPNAGTHLGG